MSALESSITLEDVFVVVGAKRVPLAPELAGYLALEIAEGAAQAAGDVEPRSVYIGEEGSVALVVRPRREPITGDSEGSIRVILARLLDASGSQTQALAAVARRRPSAGLGALVEELEAALIPVNRAAGRRALARLAREVKRVTLGVGRNASLAPGEPPPRRGSSPAHSAVRDEMRTLPREPPADATPPPPAPSRSSEALDAFLSAQPSRPEASELPTVELRREQVAASVGGRTPPPPNASVPGAGDEVDHLLASFGAAGRSEHAARSELKALVGLDPTPPPPGSEHREPQAAASSPRSPGHTPHDSDVESLLALGTMSGLSEAAPPVAPAPTALSSPPTAISPRLVNEPYVDPSRIAPPTPAASPAAHRARTSERPPGDSAARPASSPSNPGALPTAPSARRLAELEPGAGGHADRWLGALVLLILVAGGGMIWILRPSFFGGGDEHEAPPAASSASAPGATAPPPPRCHGALVVKGAPANAEILLRVGQAPVDVERMPVGARLEFVATAEGFAPKRAVVPSGATWDTGPDGKPRYEVAVQLDTSRPRPGGGADPWPPGEPGSEVGGKGSPGTVHLVTTPRGAEVWLLAGLGPEARIDQLKCGSDVEVLVAGPGALRRRLRVAEGEFVALDGGVDHEATVNASAAAAPK